MKFELPQLPFDPATLAPFLSKETFDFHHGKHHAAYVNKLNEAVANTDFEQFTLEEIIKKAQIEKNLPVYNNAAQHWNHSFFWNCLQTKNNSSPSEKISKLIDNSFGNFEKFTEQFSQSALALFGSGWIWLAINSENKLEILKQSNADNPLITDKKALLTLDVWEHAYYIDYRNARADYLKNFWDYINWNFVETQLS